MNLQTQIKVVLNKVQFSKASHQQKIQVLRQYYEKVPIEEFVHIIKTHLKILFSKKDIFAERTLEFLAHFVADVTPYDSEECFDDSNHPFLTMVVKETLKYHDLISECLRYNSCLFIRLILEYLGNQKNLDNDVCDWIQNAMLERISDPKSIVKLQAILALTRLQDNTVPECPVIKAYLNLIVDPNPQIRAEVVNVIAPNMSTIPVIIGRLRDVDVNVRVAAFRRCAEVGPRYFKIVDRQLVLNCGLSETQKKPKNVFTQSLLPKWLSAYDKDYIQFFRSLKLDADENDINNTESLTKNVMKVLLNSIPIDEITTILPLDQGKVISLDNLSSEAIVLWNILVLFLRDQEDNEDYLEKIIPDLTAFCAYIDSIVAKKSQNQMEEWECLDYHYILKNLFEIAEGYDLADEVGRRKLHQLCLKLITENFPLKLKNKLVKLADKTGQKTDNFSDIMCQIISDIRSPLVEQQVDVNPAEATNKECQKAELKVKIIRLEAALEDATDQQEFLKADGLKKEIVQLQKNLQELTAETPIIQMIKVIKDDPKTICECLDLLISLLKLKSITTMSPFLRSIKDEFLIPLLNTNSSDINWRVLNCLALYCCLDASLAEDYFKVISIPIITYRAIPNYDRRALTVSVNAVSDILRLYGATIIGDMGEPLSDSNHSLSTTATNHKRKLYRSENSNESIMSSNKFHLETLIEIILDMLDDEIVDIRNMAIDSISKLILNGFPVTPPLITRLILKWYNPLTAKSPDKLQQLLGVIISNFAKSNDEAREVIAKAIIPVLHGIASAPRTSPLADVDVENLLLFLATITNADRKADVAGTHLNMVHMFLHEMMKTKNSLMVLYLSKMLLSLDLTTDNGTVIKELIGQCERVLENETILEKSSKKNMCKFVAKLDSILENQNKTRDTNLEITENSSTTNIGEIGTSLHKDLPSITEVSEESQNHTNVINTLDNENVQNNGVLMEGPKETLSENNSSEERNVDGSTGVDSVGSKQLKIVIHSNVILTGVTTSNKSSQPTENDDCNIQENNNSKIDNTDKFDKNDTERLNRNSDPSQNDNAAPSDKTVTTLGNPNKSPKTKSKDSKGNTDTLQSPQIETNATVSSTSSTTSDNNHEANTTNNGQIVPTPCPKDAQQNKSDGSKEKVKNGRNRKRDELVNSGEFSSSKDGETSERSKRLKVIVSNSDSVKSTKTAVNNPENVNSESPVQPSEQGKNKTAASSSSNASESSETSNEVDTSKSEIPTACSTSGSNDSEQSKRNLKKTKENENNGKSKEYEMSNLVDSSSTEDSEVNKCSKRIAKNSELMKAANNGANNEKNGNLRYPKRTTEKGKKAEASDTNSEATSAKSRRLKITTSDSNNSEQNNSDDIQVPKENVKKGRNGKSESSSAQGGGENKSKQSKVNMKNSEQIKAKKIEVNNRKNADSKFSGRLSQQVINNDNDSSSEENTPTNHSSNNTIDSTDSELSENKGPKENVRIRRNGKRETIVNSEKSSSSEYVRENKRSNRLKVVVKNSERIKAAKMQMNNQKNSKFNNIQSPNQRKKKTAASSSSKTSEASDTNTEVNTKRGHMDTPDVCGRNNLDSNHTEQRKGKKRGPKKRTTLLKSVESSSSEDEEESKRSKRLKRNVRNSEPIKAIKDVINNQKNENLRSSIRLAKNNKIQGDVTEGKRSKPLRPLEKGIEKSKSPLQRLEKRRRMPENGRRDVSKRLIFPEKDDEKTRTRNKENIETIDLTIPLQPSRTSSRRQAGEKTSSNDTDVISASPEPLQISQLGKRKRKRGNRKLDTSFTSQLSSDSEGSTRIIKKQNNSHVPSSTRLQAKSIETKNSGNESTDSLHTIIHEVSRHSVLFDTSSFSSSLNNSSNTRSRSSSIISSNSTNMAGKKTSQNQKTTRSSKRR